VSNIYPVSRSTSSRYSSPDLSQPTAEEIAAGLGGKRSGRGWTCRCPAHDDRTPSLSVTEADDGKVLVRCHAGCSQDAVIDALRVSGLWPSRRGNGHSRTGNGGTNGHNVEQCEQRKPDIKVVTPDEFRSPPSLPAPSQNVDAFYEFDEITKDCARYHVYRQGGVPVRVKVKLKNETEGRYKQFYRVTVDGRTKWQPLQPEGFRSPPYGSEGCDPFRPDADRPLFWCEGEKDVDTLAAYELDAFTFGGAMEVPAGSELYTANREVIILADNDKPGRDCAENKVKRCHGLAASIKVLHFPDLPEHGDVTDYIVGIPDEANNPISPPHAVEDLLARVEATPEWTPPTDDADIKADNDDELRTVAASSLDMKAIDWLWPERFALGKIALIAGLPDYGKGQIAAFLAAAVTAGVEFPCGEGQAPQGNVIWFNAEDDARDTVLPRLIAAGADPHRVHFVNGVRGDGKDKSFSLVTDLPLLRKAIKKIGNVKLVIIDPVSAYMGVGKVNMSSATDTRGVLTPLKELAEDLHLAVIGIAHFNKKVDVTSALLRVGDSIALTAAARSVYVVLDDPEDSKTRLFVKAKANIAKDKMALRYGIGVKKVGHDQKLGVDINAPHIVWHPQHVEVTANEAMAAASGGGGGAYAMREAREFLLDRLRAGPVKADEITEEAEQIGISNATLRRARRNLGIRPRKERGKIDGGWIWELPPAKVLNEGGG
jgi:putative DNA primase/helicase